MLLATGQKARRPQAWVSILLGRGSEDSSLPCCYQIACHSPRCGLGIRAPQYVSVVLPLYSLVRESKLFLVFVLFFFFSLAVGSSGMQASPGPSPGYMEDKRKTQEGIHCSDPPSLNPQVPRQFTFFLAFRVLYGCLLIYFQDISLYLEGRSRGKRGK